MNNWKIWAPAMLTLFISSVALSKTIGNSQHYLNGGDQIPVGELEAVGQVPGCTATLISETLVLTAAHCVCSGQTTPSGCRSRANFTLRNVHLVDDPATKVNESLERRDITMAGSVQVHPRYTSDGWLSNDFAKIELDQKVSELVLGVRPIPVELPSKRPRINDRLTLVGFGRTGDDCQSPPRGKRRITLPLFEISKGNVTFRIGTRKMGSCPGDSGGPALNSSGNIVGVSSSVPGNYDPTYLAYSWLFGTGRILQTSGKVSFIRVHEVGSGYGPATDPVDGEVVVKLNNGSDLAFGFALRKGANEVVHKQMLNVVRQAFVRDVDVSIEYEKVGPKSAKILRVALSR